MTAEDDERIKDFFYHQMHSGGSGNSTTTNSTMMGDQSRNTMMSRQTQRGGGGMVSESLSYMMTTETRMPTVQPRIYATQATTTGAELLIIDPKELGKEF